MRKTVLENLKYAALFFVAGALMLSGMKAVDWLIPDPPDAPLVVIHKTEDGRILE